MADNIKDVALNLKVAASGNEQIKALVDQLEALAKEGGRAAPEFKRLAEELKAVGTQSQALQAFAQLEAEIQESTAAVEKQRTAVSGLRTAYEQQAASTEEFRAKQAATKAALNETVDAIRKVEAQVRSLKTDQTDLVKGTTAYENQLANLKATLANLRNEQGQQKTELRQANDALKQSETVLKGVSDQYTRAASEAEKLERSLTSQRQQLNGARDAMNATGVAATTVAEATQEVNAAFDAQRTKVAGVIQAEQQLKSVTEAVAASNARAVEQAKSAAAAREAAAKQVTLAEREAANAAEAQALAAKLAAEQQIAAQRSVADYIRESNQRNVDLAQRAAQQRVAASNQIQAEERETAEVAEAAALKQKLAYEGIEANIKQARVEAQALADRLQQALAVTGVKAAQDLEREIKDVREAMTLLRTSSDLTGRELDRAMADGQKRINQLERELRAATGQMTLLDRASNAFKSSIGQFTAGFLIAEAVQRLAVGALEANKNMETLQRGLKAVYGDARVAAQQIEFLKKTADNAGISVNDISKSFVQFSAAMKTSGFSLQVTQDLFKGITAEAANLGLSGEKVSDMLNALGQIASKGTVQLEELKNQLGDALPGALKRTADALGITLPELLELTSSGKLLADDVLPALANALKGTASDASTFAGVYANLKNTLSEVAVQIGDTGLWTTLKVVLLSVGTAAATLGQGIQLIFDGVLTGVKQVAAALSVLVTGDFRTAYSEINRLGKEFIDRQAERGQKFQDLMARNAASFNAITGEQEKFGASAEQVGAKAEAAGNQIAAAGTKAEAAGTQAAGAAGGMQANAAAQTAAGAAATTNASAQTAAGTAAAGAGTQADGAGNQWLQLEKAYGKVNTALEEQVKNARVAAEAAKSQGDAIQRLAELSGNEAQALQGAAEAARVEAVAKADLAAKSRTVVDVLEAERDALVILKQQLGDTNGARQKVIDAINETIAKKTEEATKDREAAEAARAELEQKKLAAEVYRDNSARLEELRAASVASTNALKELALAFVKGRISSEEFSAAQTKAAKDQRLYRDAISDTMAAIARKTDVQRAESNVVKTSLQLDLEKAKSSEAVARAYGNERQAVEAQINQKRIEIKIAGEALAVKQKEVDAYRELTRRQLESYEALGPLTQAQKDEIAQREANARAMQNEISIGRERINQLNTETEAIERKNAAQAAGIGSSSSAPAAQSTLARGGKNVDENGFSKDIAGNTVNALGETWLSIYNQLKSYGVDERKAKSIANEFVDEKGDVVFFDNPGQIKYGGSTLSDAIQKAAMKVLNTQGAIRDFGVTSPINRPRTPAPAPAPRPQGTTQVTPRGSTITPQPVIINVNGQSTQIEVGNLAQAQALQDLLKAIASGQSRSGV